MLDLLSIQVAQPDLLHLNFKDTTPTGTGGWNTGSGGDYLMSASSGFLLELKRHTDDDFYSTDQNPVSIADTIYNAAFATTQATFARGSATENWLDGIYTIKYSPYSSSYPTILNTVVTNVLVLAQTRIQEAKMLNKRFAMPYGGLQDEMSKLLNDLRVAIMTLKSLVLADNYTAAVIVFDETQTILENLESIR